jgi:hypothetical protein
MALTLEQIIGAESQLGLIEGVKTGIKRPLPDEWFRSSQKVEGNSGKYTKVEGTRETARLVQYGSASRGRNLAGVSEVPINLMHSFEHMAHGPSLLSKLMNVEGQSFNGTPSTTQKMGMGELKRQSEIFKQRFENLRTAAVMMALSRGVIYFDANGNLQNTSSGAVVSVDFQVPAGHKGQLDWAGSGAIIGASWATAGTDIITDMEQIHEAAQAESGYPIEVAIYGKNILKNFVANTALLGLINGGSNADANAFARRMIPDGFLNVAKWIPAPGTAFADNDGTYQRLIPDDTIVFCPQPDPSWFDIIEGTFPVPTGTGNVREDAAAMLSDLKLVSGMFGFSAVSRIDPPGIVQYAGDTFLPALKVPKAIFIADVTP